MLNRRGFLGLLAGAVTEMALDPERLLWRPSAKLISIPAPRLAGDLTLGDIITIAGQYTVNPLTRLPAEYIDEFGKAHRSLQLFVVTEVVEGHPSRLWPHAGRTQGEVRQIWDL